MKSNLEISAGLKFMALSPGSAIGKLVLVEEGAAMPLLGRSDVAPFLGDVRPDAPPVDAMITTQVQTYISHLGIKYRQDDTPYFYKAFPDAEIAALRELAGTPVAVNATGADGTVTPATQAEADEYLERIRPKGRIRLSPDLGETRILPSADLMAISVIDGRWSTGALSAYGRKTLGVVHLAHLFAGATSDQPSDGSPAVVAPDDPFGIPASWYARVVRSAVDEKGVTLSERARAMTEDPHFREPEWKAAELAKLRKAIAKASMPADVLGDLERELAVRYLAAHPGAEHARMRSSAPVVEDSGDGRVKLPNMAGAFDSHTLRWERDESAALTSRRAAEAMAEALQKDYTAVWNDRAVSELEWHNVDLDEGSVAMAVLVMPNEDGEKANGVLRVNRDLAGFFSITGETQFGENLVTNPEAGATPDAWIDGDYDVLNGVQKQDIEHERISSLTSGDPSRPHAFTDAEIDVAFDAMRDVREYFATLAGVNTQDYIDECEVKVLADGSVQLKQERPWVE